MKEYLQGKIERVVLLGAGNVATHLGRALHEVGVQIVCVYSRDVRNASALAAIVSAQAVDSVENLPDADAYIFAVKDDALPSLVARVALLHPNRCFIHTAGSVSLAVFQDLVADAAVMYPMQTFSKQIAVSFAGLPIYIEATNDCTLRRVEQLALSTGAKVTPLDSERRKYLHLAAVFACNFANHCFALASDVMEQAGLPFSDLIPLIETTTQKLRSTSPAAGQTGPAVRGDMRVQQAHCHLLAENSLAQDIYKLLSQSIYLKANPAQSLQIRTGAQLLAENERLSTIEVAPQTNIQPSMINYDLTKIKGIAFDVDGVLSSNLVMLDGSAQPVRTANIKDGYAMQLAVKKGLNLAIITGGKSEAVRQRYVNLGLQNVFIGVSVKIEIFKQWLEESGLQADEVIYVGDDIPDYEVMRMCGCPCCPSDAAPEIRAISTYISDKAGGQGCGRDIIEQVLRAQGLWMSDAEAFGW